MSYIHDKLDVKMLVLYLTARITEPIGFDTLTDLVMRHGVDYFLYVEALSELVDSAHLNFDGDLYAITEKGKSTSSACETSLPPSVRQRSDQEATRINAVLRRRAQVKGERFDNADGSVTARMSLNDDRGTLLALELLCPSQEQADQLISTFQAKPEWVYNHILEALSPLEGKEAEPHV